MADELIENPIPNSPYSEPNRHFKFGDEGITNEIQESRRVSAVFTRDAFIAVIRRAVGDTSTSGNPQIPSCFIRLSQIGN